MPSRWVEDVTAPSPGSTSSLRVANHHRVIKVLQETATGRPVTQADIARAWKHILGKVSSYADLEPSLLGRVEELIDFVTGPDTL